MVRFTLNGKKVEYDGEEESLLRYLRYTLRLGSVKDGCSSQGACGSCLVEIDGKAKLACRQKMADMEGRSIVTIDGFPEELKRTLGESFVASGAVQCGFCSPGMLTRTKILLETNPNPTREEAAKAIRTHLCRCTGYVKIVDAIMLAAEKLRTGEKVEMEQGGMGKSAPKFQAYERATGGPLFADGMYFDDQLLAALKLSDHPRARVLKIDTSKAEAVEGVVKVLTYRDVPGKRRIGMITKDWDAYIAEGEVTRYVGDVIACVLADRMLTARAAAKLIEVEYEVLEPLTDMRQAENSDIKVHEGGNLLKKTNICYGDPVEDVFEKSDYVVEGTYETQLIEHAFLEVESSLARYEDGRLTVYTQGQGIYEDRKQIADLLGLKPEEVNVKLVPSGGAFGGKEDLIAQGHAALGAYLLKRPVKLTITRDDSIRMHAKRHPMIMEYRLGCTKDGKFTGLRARIIGDTGAYASAGGPVMERAATHAGGAYYIPNIDVESKALYTNNLPAGAMRGFGVNQVTFAMESLIDELCAQKGFDRWEIRYKNALEPGLTTTSGHKIRKDIGLKKTLERVKAEYDSNEYVGIACGIKNCGIGNGIPELSEVRIDIADGGDIKLYHGWSEMGQGVDTAAQQMLCEYLGLPDTSGIEIIVMTDSETHGGSTTASRGTFLVGKALLEAAKDLKKDMETKTLAELAGRSYRGTYLCDWTTPPGYEGDIVSHFAYSYATQIVILDESGKIRKVTAAHDSGKVVNRKLFEGQIEGGVVMGLGYALSENLELDKGHLKHTSYAKLGLLRSGDVPVIDVIPIEIYDEDAPFGAKGVGEICCIPTAAAAAGAFRRYDGEKRTKLPLTPLNKKT